MESVAQRWAPWGEFRKRRESTPGGISRAELGRREVFPKSERAQIRNECEGIAHADDLSAVEFASKRDGDGGGPRRWPN